MKIGLSMLYCLGKPFPLLVEELKKVTIKNIELVDEGLHVLNSRRVGLLKKVVQEKGFCLSVHAPFADVNIASPSGYIRRTVLKRLRKSLLFSSNLSSNLWVFHPGLKTGISHIYPCLDWEINLETVCELKKFADELGLNIAIENGPSPFPFLLTNVEDFTRFYEELADLELGLALDVGHANLNNQIYRFMETFSQKIIHAHVHDNNGDRDSHLGIGEGNIDWVKVISNLKRIDYKGTLIIESERSILESLERLKAILQSI